MKGDLSRRHRYLELLILFGLALFARLLYIKLYPAYYLISSDGLTYSNIAENLLQGKGFITTIRDRDYAVGPIYPLLIAVTYIFFGMKNYFAVVLLQAVISALTTVLAYLIGERLFGKAYAWVPYLLMLAYPMFSFWTIYVLTETTYIFMITLFMWAVVFYSQNVQQGRKHLSSTLLLGVILGLGNLVRPILLLIFPVLFFWQWFLNNWDFKKGLRDIILVGLAMSLIMSPWWVRNALRYHQFVAATNYGAYEFYAGNNPYTVTDDFFVMALKTYDPEVKARVEKLPLMEQEKEYSRLAKTYILQHPIKFIERTLTKAINLFWKPLTIGEQDFFKFYGYQYDAWYLVLGLIGGILGLVQFRRYGFVVLLTMYYSLVVSLITIVQPARYRVPIMPAIVILASLVVVNGIKVTHSALKSLLSKD